MDGPVQLVMVAAGAGSHLLQQHLPGQEPARRWAKIRRSSSCLSTSYQGLSSAEPNQEYSWQRPGKWGFLVFSPSITQESVAE